MNACRRLSFRYPDAQVTDYKDLAALRAALERLPCCATDARGSAQGDPLNVVFVGDYRGHRRCGRSAQLSA